MKLIGVIDDRWLVFELSHGKNLSVNVEDNKYVVHSGWLSMLRMSEEDMLVTDTHENEEKALEIIKAHADDIADKHNKIGGASDELIELQDDLIKRAPEYGNLVRF